MDHLIGQGDAFHAEQVQPQSQHFCGYPTSTTFLLPPGPFVRGQLFEFFRNLVVAFKYRVGCFEQDLCFLGGKEVERK